MSIFNPDIKNDPEAQQRVRGWIEVLRSGRYHQAKGVLHRPGTEGEGAAGTFCCLGVYLDMTRPEGWVLKKDRDACLHPQAESAQRGRGIFMLNRTVRSTLRLTKSGAEHLAHMNDQRYSFEAIADRIEHDLTEALA